MKTKSLDRFTRRVWLALVVVTAYLLLLAGIGGVTLWRSHLRLEEETARRARAAAQDLFDQTPELVRSSLRDWARGAPPRRPPIAKELAHEHGIVAAELLSPEGWAIDARSGEVRAESTGGLSPSQVRHLAAGETLIDVGGLDGEAAYAVVTAWHPVLDDDARLLGALRVEVEAEPLALSLRQLRWAAAIQGGSILAFVALLVLFTRWALRPLALLDEARQAPEGPVDALALEDDTGFVVETYRKVIQQLREKETELRRLRELERHRADELQELNASIVDSMLSGVIVLDLSGSIRTMNAVARDILGIPGSERVTGRPVADVVRHAPELQARLLACLQRGEARERDEVRLNLPGHGRRDVSLAVSPLRAATGEQRGALAILVDATEVKRLQETVRLKESMAELGELSAGIAHEFRNSLATILGFARLVEKQGGAESREHAMAITAECTALRRVVDDFLRFANPARLVVEPVDLASLFADLREDLKQRACGRTVAYEVQPGLPTISGDETLLRRAFTNLVRNACDAAPEGGRVSVSHEIAGRELVLHVDDDGPGIPPDERQRVFIPFFTRKEHGTGLGLALARKVVVHHGGRIAVEDAPSGGARLSVTLPLRPPSPEGPGPVGSASQDGHQT